MSVETSTARISESELSEHLTEVLDRVARGERIAIQRAGRKIAIIGPPEAAPSHRQASTAPAERGESVFDEELVRNVRAYREWANAASLARETQ